MVGADGIHSTVRALAVGSSPPSYAGQMVWRSVITSRPQGIVDNMMVLMGNGCFFGLVPMVKATHTASEPLTRNASKTGSPDASNVPTPLRRIRRAGS